LTDVGRPVTCRRPSQTDSPRHSLQVVSVVSNKGGVGKTTIATNLAIYIRALREELPILVIGLDDQNLIDRMFALEPGPPDRTIADALLHGDLLRAVRHGQYGIHYVPSPVDLSELRARIGDPLHLRRLLEASGWSGLVILDTKSALDILTRNAIAASDLTLVVVKDHQSLLEADKVFDLIENWGADRECARVVLSLVDRRVKYEPGQTRDILALLLMAIRERDYPLFQAFVSRSPRVEALHTNERGAPISILNGAADTLVHEQMRLLAIDLLAVLDEDAADSRSRDDDDVPGPYESDPMAPCCEGRPLPHPGFVSHLTHTQREDADPTP
jgi:cellulose biosynthesis protein BcsQ